MLSSWFHLYVNFENNFVVGQEVRVPSALISVINCSGAILENNFFLSAHLKCHFDHRYLFPEDKTRTNPTVISEVIIINL